MTAVEEIQLATHEIIHFGYPLAMMMMCWVLLIKHLNNEYYQSYIEESQNIYATERDNYSSSLLTTIAYDTMWTLGLVLHSAKENYPYSIPV